jgi:hypothetical protein
VRLNAAQVLPGHALALLAAWALAACASRPPPPAPEPAPPPAAHESDPSFDWQVLMIAPMGSTLRSIPAALHEALLFHEAAGARSSDDGECYAPDSAPPRFLAHTPEEYLLCFRQDHLLRIRASVQLGEADAESIFREACARWQRQAAAANGAAAADAAAIEADAPDGAVCRGRMGSVRFSARLGEDSDQAAGAPEASAAPERAVAESAEGAQKTTPLSVVLDGVAD